MYTETHIGENIAFCLSKADFISRIESGARAIKLILVYGHGGCGTELFVYESDSGEKIVITAPNVVGPYFKFAEDENETLIPEDFDKLAKADPTKTKK